MELRNGFGVRDTLLMLATAVMLAACGPDASTGAPATTGDQGNSEIDVTPENFAYAESSMYFQKQQDKYPVNQWQHVRQMADVDNQDIIRMNADTAYSIAIVDVSEGATVSLPESDAYQSILVIDLNHYNPYVIYSGESIHLTLDDVTIGEHVYLLMRTSEEDMMERQDAAVIDAKSSKPFISERFNSAQLDSLRAELMARMTEIQPRAHLACGRKEDVDPDVHLVASAAGWAGLPAHAAMYIPDIPVADRSGVCSAITFRPPNLHYEKGAFWSITVYDPKGWIATDNFATNSKKSSPNDDGTYTIHFNCEGQRNNLTVVDGWNATFRMYMPVDVQENLGYMLEMINENSVAVVD